MTTPSDIIKDRLTRLRAELTTQGLGGFVVPLTDEHQSEYVASYAQRLNWISGFDGSCGTAIVLQNKAAVFVDGRYTIQVRDQVDAALLEIVQVEDTSPVEWLKANMEDGDRIGFDPFLHNEGWVKTAKTAVTSNRGELAAVEHNPIDTVWTDQPAEPNTAVTVQSDDLAGEGSHSKRQRLGKAIKEQGADAAVITQLDSIAWLFNIRSGDVSHTPVSLAFATLDADGQATLFIDPSKVTGELKDHLGNQVAVEAKSEFINGLKALGGKSVLMDPATASFAIFETLDDAGAKIVKAMDPCALPKAAKNDVEISGSRAAHIRDGAAVTKFLRWLSIEGPKGGLTEMDAADKLLSFRAQDPTLKDSSFDTISAAGEHGAICHYRVTDESNLAIGVNSVFLIDSGGQYPDGTTDITRTVEIGVAPTEAKERFTLVLRGHIALATAIFPEGTTGPALDSFARRPLWEAGLDYDHGTGHGVGSFLAVHEGPGRISKAPNTVKLQPGMIFSNEPGYYKDGEYGIRIENLVVIEPRDVGGDRKMMGFDELTFAPIDRNMIVVDMLDDKERNWLNTYHVRVRDALSPLLDGDDLAWMIEQTAEI